MLEKFMWNSFEKTGNIDAYLSYKEINRVNISGKSTPAEEDKQDLSLTFDSK